MAKPAQTTLWVCDVYGRREFALRPTAFTSLAYTLSANTVTNLKLTAPLAIFPAAFLRSGWVDRWIEVVRTNSRGVDSLEGDRVWFMRSLVKDGIRRNSQMVEIGAVSSNQLLNRRVVAYAEGTTYADKAGMAADAMMRQYVRDAFTAPLDATRQVATSYFTVDPDPSVSLCGTISMQQSKARLLQVCQDIAQASAQHPTTPRKLTFDVVRPNPFTPQLVFRVYPDRRGDRQIVEMAPASFSSLSITEDYTDAVSFLYGQGTGQEDQALQSTAQVATPLSGSPFVRYEDFFSASNQTVQAALDARTKAALRQQAPRAVLTGTIQESLNDVYGVDWGWGDQRIAVVDNRSYLISIDTVSVSIQNNKESVTTAIRGEAEVYR